MRTETVSPGRLNVGRRITLPSRLKKADKNLPTETVEASIVMTARSLQECVPPEVRPRANPLNRRQKHQISSDRSSQSSVRGDAQPASTMPESVRGCSPPRVLSNLRESG